MVFFIYNIFLFNTFLQSRKKTQKTQNINNQTKQKEKAQTMIKKEAL